LQSRLEKQAFQARKAEVYRGDILLLVAIPLRKAGISRNKKIKRR